MLTFTRRAFPYAKVGIKPRRHTKSPGIFVPGLFVWRLRGKSLGKRGKKLKRPASEGLTRRRYGKILLVRRRLSGLVSGLAELRRFFGGRVCLGKRVLETSMKNLFPKHGVLLELLALSLALLAFLVYSLFLN